ncbi:MAG: hypothetical protein WDA18_04020 [Candidatus Ratteibacteria bacterium]
MSVKIFSNMAKLLNWINAEKKIRDCGITIFSPVDLKRIFGVSEVSVRFFLTRYVKKGAIVKLRNSLYTLNNNIPSEVEIANALYRPSYISLTYALAYYHIIPEMVYSITSVTTLPTARFNAINKEFRYHKIKASVFTGYSPVKIEGKTILFACKEKAFVDYLYFVLRKSYKLNERIDISGLDKKELTKYVKLFNNKGINELIERI